MVMLPVLIFMVQLQAQVIFSILEEGTGSGAATAKNTLMCYGKQMVQ